MVKPVSVRSDAARIGAGIAVAACLSFVGIYWGLFTGRVTFSHDTCVWASVFYYYVDAISAGVFPYWDPYLNGGTFFYPNVALHGLLDPIVLMEALVAKATDVSLVSLYNYFRIIKLFVVVVGSYLFYKRIVGDRAPAVFASAILLFVFPLSYFRQFGTVDAIYLTPITSYCVLAFLEGPSGPRRALFLALAAVAAGISMINYIPSFFLFNLVCLVPLVFAFRLVSVRSVTCAFRERRLLLFAALLLVAVGCMSAPPVATLWADASGGGELFPMQRVVQKAGHDFVKLVASEVGTHALSGEFRDHQAAMNSWGEVANLVFPDRLSFPYWRDHNLQSEVDHYIGILPLIFALSGVLLVRSRYRWLLLSMAAVHFVNGFSIHGFGAQQYNLVQRGFNVLFPPLTWYHGRMNLGCFFLFYLCGFAALGAKAFLDGALFHGRGRSVVVALCATICGAKVVVSWWFAGAPFATSIYDGFVLAQVAFLAAGTLAVGSGRLSGRWFVIAVLAVTLVDFWAYNENAKARSTLDSRLDREITAEGRGRIENAENFEFLRAPFFLEEGEFPAMAESVRKVKGALSGGYNHSLFTTKRSYDLLVNVPLQTQFVLGGMMSPLLRYFPEEQVLTVGTRSELLETLVSIAPQQVAVSLFLEPPAAAREPAAKLGSASQYPIAPWLRPAHVLDSYEQFLEKNGRAVDDVTANLPQALGGFVASVNVESFSRNTLSVHVATPRAGYLYYGDGWSKHWKAYDGDRQVPLWIANYNGKAVHVGPGEHLIRFVFDPIAYRFSLYAYYGGLFFLFLTLVFLVGREVSRRREKVPPTGSDSPPLPLESPPTCGRTAGSGSS